MTVTEFALNKLLEAARAIAEEKNHWNWKGWTQNQWDLVKAIRDYDKLTRKDDDGN